MCGIAGIISKEKVSALTIKSMTDSIAHRGPDADGHWVDENIGLGHRRLSIIDLSEAAQQPMISMNNRYIISYNGEIYNFKELRVQLESLGHKFFSNSDTEVVLNSYIQWGEECLEKFNGMFAFAVWDCKKKFLFLARDKYGIKPIYYTFNEEGFVFGSEIKAILASKKAKTEMNKNGLVEYFTFQNFFTNETLFKNINILPAGNFLVIDQSLSNMRLTQYWDFKFEEDSSKIKEEEYIEELQHLLEQAISRQLVSDVEIGTYLSGGMDSGTIAAISSSKLPNIKSFTVGFDLSSASGMEMAFDERAKAESMSYQFKTEHYEMVLKAGDMERCMNDLVYHLEEPRVGMSYPNFYAAKLASKFGKVVLSGAGGDELFGGYPWRYYNALNVTSYENYVDQYYLYWQRLISNKDIKNLFRNIYRDIEGVWTRDIMSDILKSHKNNKDEFINHSLYFEAKTFLHGLFVVEDKLSMAHSLESRVPFLDDDLVNFAMKVPVSLKINNLSEVKDMNENDLRKQFIKNSDGKAILRKAMEKYLPKEVTQRDKQGFSAPDNSWFKGDSIDYVKDTLINNNAKIYNYLDKDEVQKIISEHLKGEKNRRLLIWSLLNVEAWCHIFDKN